MTVRYATLRQVEIFEGLDAESLDRLAQEFVELHVPADHLILQEGLPVESFYVVREGQVVVFRDAVGKPIQLLGRIGAHEYFGELSLFHDGPSSVSARAVETSRVLKVDRDILLGFLDEHPEVILRLQMAAARRHSIHAAAALELGQRNEVRIRIGKEVLLTFEDGTSRVVTLDNLSPGGLCLRGSAEEWRQDEDVSFLLRYKAHVLPCRGRVSWVRGSLVGIAFSELSREHEQRVQQSLRQLLT